MLVKEILNSNRPSLSLEFFPPKTKAGFDKLFQIISNLMQLKPSYASVTYGAGGSTRDDTANLVVQIQKDMGLTVVSHLTCVGSTRDELMSILEKAAEGNIENILALRGDIPEGETVWKQIENGFDYAVDFVSFIKKNYPHICIGVAGFPEGHPLTPNRLKEIEYLKAKVDAGADYIVTQLFLDNRNFYDFCERCELAGIHVPVIAGVMPITTRKGMIRMAELAEGACFPACLLRSVARAENDEYFEEVGIHWAAEQLLNLVNNDVHGIHLYTLNRSRAILQIFKSLGIRDATQF
ncbi:MAG: methylenetetrahydrofolate reductase [NAD(P)H] [Desulfobacteraceae bacterium]|nr:methylenetetrahydrofolate reductase [NAD(P)H] [Desulfobacteraceae bacterium]MBC2720546.1 methylenetetrahydrofolate reductase [NAD(P)H] [Desulfobacteraceae bacterium]